MECLDHKKCLTECACPLPQDLVRFHRDDGTEGKYEGMDVLHVEIVRGHGVRHGVISHALRVLAGHATHVLRVQLHGIIAELGSSGGLQVLTAYRKIAVSPHPSVQEGNASVMRVGGAPSVVMVTIVTGGASL